MRMVRRVGEVIDEEQPVNNGANGLYFPLHEAWRCLWTYRNKTPLSGNTSRPCALRSLQREGLN